MAFNLEKFKKVFADPSNYAPLAEFRKLDLDDHRITAGYTDAVQFLADSEELQEYYLTLDYERKMDLVELLAAGIVEKQLRQEMENRPWAYEKEISERNAKEQKAKQQRSRTPKPSWLSRKKPLSQWEISQAQKRGTKAE